jgi:uncharacterized membrane protein (DUF485 family)
VALVWKAQSLFASAAFVLTIGNGRSYTANQCGRVSSRGYFSQTSGILGMFVSTRNSRIGLALFALYMVFYGGFVLIAAFSPGTMEATPLAGVNLAIWYGFGLIVAAILLAILYGLACRKESLPAAPSLADNGGGP